MGRKTRHTPAQIKIMLGEINLQTDRGAAIIAAGVLDELLNVCLQNRMLEMNRKRYDALFDFRGPLGTFSAKIELAMALGFYSEAGYNSLHAIRDIRNKFSHRIEPMTFDHGDVAEIVDTEFATKYGETRRDKFLTAFRLMAMILSASQNTDIRVRDLGQTHPELYVEMYESVSLKTAQLLEEVLQEENDPPEGK